MTAYGSYLPRRSDQTNNAVLVSCLNCGFEYVAGIAIFAILFAFAAVPQASTIAMTFFIVPQGIGQLPGGPAVVTTFGSLFFLLLLLAGLSSTVSMVESLVSALLDKFQWPRSSTVLAVCVGGALLSTVFTLPHVIDPNLTHNGTLGLTLLDLLDHWAFSYGLLIVGLSQCLLLGKRSRIRRLRLQVNATSSWVLGRWYEWLIGILIPFSLALVLFWALLQDLRGGLYGVAYVSNLPESWSWLRPAPKLALVGWLLVPTTVALLLTRVSGRAETAETNAHSPQSIEAVEAEPLPLA